jgi:beta-phosphoglucomutase-like phosphatase (HAD superfamily)
MPTEPTIRSPRLPAGLRAYLFDLDGVLTRTASLHAAAWKAMFDRFLAEYAQLRSEPFAPFDMRADYERYVDGRPRDDGTRTFLVSRGIELPEGAADDEPGAWTIKGLGLLKNADVVRRIAGGEVEVFDGSVEFVRRVRAAGLRTAVVSSSANTVDVLRVTGLRDLFEARIDGIVARGGVCLATRPGHSLAVLPPSGRRQRRQPSSRTRPPGSRPGGRAVSPSSSE